MEIGAMMQSVHSFRGYLSIALRYCCAFLAFILTALVFIQVLFRFVFRHPFDWAEELARYFFIWVSILGAVLAIEAKAHFYVDIFPNMLSPKNRRILDLSMRGIVFLFLAAVACVSIKLTIIMGSQLSPVLNVPLSYVAIVLPIGFFIMCFFLLFSGIFQEPPGKDK